MDPTINAAEQSILKHWDCIASAVNEVFATSCGTEIELCDDDGMGMSADHSVILAIISFIGDVEWSVFFVYPEETAEAVATRFAQYEVSFDSYDMGDAVGELANVIAGKIKMILDSRGAGVEISLPTVISGDSMELLILQGISSWKECYDSQCGKFWGGIFAGNQTRLTEE